MVPVWLALAVAQPHVAQVQGMWYRPAAASGPASDPLASSTRRQKVTREQLHRKIVEILADEDYYGGPIFRAYPLACRVAIADAIMDDVENLIEEAKGTPS